MLLRCFDLQSYFCFSQVTLGTGNHSFSAVKQVRGNIIFAFNSHQKLIPIAKQLTSSLTTKRYQNVSSKLVENKQVIEMLTVYIHNDP